MPHTYPPVNDLGEPLERLLYDAFGVVIGASYRPKPASTNCLHCGEPVEGNHLTAIVEGRELVGFAPTHSKCAVIARGKRQRRPAVPLMAPGTSANEWKAIEQEQAAGRTVAPAGRMARVAEGNEGPEAPANSDEAT